MTTWVQEATKIWADHIGLLPHGRIGRALLPAVELYGPDETLRWFRTYCTIAPMQKRDGSLANEWDSATTKAGNVRFLSPEGFIKTLQVWRELSEPVPE